MRRLARQLPRKSLEKLYESRKKKDFQSTKGLGGRPEGEVIATIKNYSGANTSLDGDTRVLRSKHHIPSSLEIMTSLPTWITPDYYFNKEKNTSLNSKGDRFYQSPFRSSPRKDFLHEHAPTSATDSNELHIHGNSSSRRRSSNFDNEFNTPHYGTPKSCHRTHSAPSEELSTWSKVSPKSTMTTRPPYSGIPSPRNAILGPLFAGSGSGHDTMESKDRFISTTNSSSMDSSKGADPNATSRQLHLDSVLQKLQKRENRRYKVKDYTLGGLSNHQSNAPNEHPYLGHSSKSMHDVINRVEVQQMLNELFGHTEVEVECTPASSPLAMTMNGNGNGNDEVFETTLGRKNKPLMESSSPTPKLKASTSSPANLNTNSGRFSVTRSSDMLSNTSVSAILSLKDTKLLDSKGSGSESSLRTSTATDDNNDKNRFQKSNYVNLALAESKLGYQSSCLSNNRRISRHRLHSRGHVHSSEGGKNPRTTSNGADDVDLKGLLLRGPGVNIDGNAHLYSPPDTVRAGVEYELAMDGEAKGFWHAVAGPGIKDKHTLEDEKSDIYEEYPEDADVMNTVSCSYTPSSNFMIRG